MQNITNSDSKAFSNTTLVIGDWLGSPEYFNLLFLLMTVYGMYQGIEINHPLYAVLFADLIVATIFMVVNILGFPFIASWKYIVLSTTCNNMVLFFHCNCWCVTSIIRYIYIIHEDWMQKVLPNFKGQCGAALLLTLTMSSCCTVPMISYGIHLGEF